MGPALCLDYISQDAPWSLFLRGHRCASRKIIPTKLPGPQGQPNYNSHEAQGPCG